MITFKRTHNRQWLGNGFGYAPARYEIRRDGRRLGAICYSAARGWTAEVLGTRFDREKLAECKAAVVASLKTMP